MCNDRLILNSRTHTDSSKHWFRKVCGAEQELQEHLLSKAQVKGQVQGLEQFLTQFLLKLTKNDDTGEIVIGGL